MCVARRMIRVSVEERPLPHSRPVYDLTFFSHSFFSFHILGCTGFSPAHHMMHGHRIPLARAEMCSRIANSDVSARTAWSSNADDCQVRCHRDERKETRCAPIRPRIPVQTRLLVTDLATTVGPMGKAPRPPCSRTTSLLTL